MNLEWLASAREELARNHRLRIGLVIIVVLIAMYQIADLGQLRARMAGNYSRNQARLARVRNLSHQDDWSRRASDIAKLRKALEAQIPDADSIGLAQATFQGWLRGLVVSSNRSLSISMGTPTRVKNLPGYWKIPARISGTIGVRPAMELIRQVESRKELVVVDSIRLTNSDHPSLSLDVASYYHISQ